MVYTSNVNIFRSSEATGYRYLSRVYRMSFLAAAAEKRPRCLQQNGQYRLNPDSERSLLGKIATVLCVAQRHNHDAVVLSALGMP